MSHKLPYFLDSNQKEGILDYLVENDLSKNVTDFLIGWFTKYLVGQKSIISTCMSNGFIELRNNRAELSKIPFKQETLDHEDVKNDSDFKLNDELEKSIFAVGKITYNALCQAYKFQNIINRESGLKNVPSIEEFYHNLVVGEVNRCITSTLESEIKNEFKQIKNPKKKKA